MEAHGHSISNQHGQASPIDAFSNPQSRSSVCFEERIRNKDFLPRSASSIIRRKQVEIESLSLIPFERAIKSSLPESGLLDETAFHVFKAKSDMADNVSTSRTPSGSTDVISTPSASSYRKEGDMTHVTPRSILELGHLPRQRDFSPPSKLIGFLNNGKQNFERAASPSTLNTSSPWTGAQRSSVRGREDYYGDDPYTRHPSPIVNYLQDDIILGINIRPGPDYGSNITGGDYQLEVEYSLSNMRGENLPPVSIDCNLTTIAMSWVDESRGGRVTQKLNHDDRPALRLPRLTPGNKLSIAYRLPLRDIPFRSSAAEEGPQAFCCDDVSEEYDFEIPNTDPAEPELISCNTESGESGTELLEDTDTAVADSLLHSNLEKTRGAIGLKPVVQVVKGLGSKRVLTRSHVRRWTRKGILLGLVILFIYFYRHSTQDDGRSLASGLFPPIRIHPPHDIQTFNRRWRHIGVRWPKGLFGTLSTSRSNWKHNMMPEVTQGEETKRAIEPQTLCASFSSTDQPGAGSIEDTKAEYQVVGSDGGKVRGERMSQKPLLDWIDHALGWKSGR